MSANQSTMAQTSVKVAKMARFLAIAHIILGFLLICFGIADHAIKFRYSRTGEFYFGIWIGAWVSYTICELIS